MKPVSKILFNTLVLRQSVNLPQLGSLQIDIHPATMHSKTRLVPPYTSITFSRSQSKHFPSFVDIIAREAAVRDERAKSIYKHWLEEVTKDGVVKVESVGEFKGELFTPTEELMGLLNPAGTSPKATIKLKKVVEPGKLVARLVIVAMLVAVAAFFSWRYIMRDKLAEKDKIAHSVPGSKGNDGFDMRDIEVNDLEARKNDTLKKDSVPTVSEVIKATLDKDTTASGGAASQTTIATAATATVQSPQESAPVATGRSYYVMLGVFSLEENADKYIRQTRANGGDTLNYNKFRMSNGRYGVSIMTCRSEKEAIARRDALKRMIPDVWVYSEKNK